MAKSEDGFEAMMNMWKQGSDMFMKAQKEAAENFTKVLSNNTAPAAPAMPGADEAMKVWQGFIKSWAPQWDPSSMATNPLNQNMFTSGRDQLFAMLDSSNWMNHAPEQLREILSTVANGPKFADLATPQAEAAEAWREVIDYQKAAADFAKALHVAWTEAFENYSKEHSLEDLQSGDVKGALDAWLKAANAALLKTQRTPEFMDAQRRLMRASTEIKARQMEVAEAWSEAYQIPTRTEIDDLTRIVQELRREVRKLKREVAAKA